jgi:SAM-dependent methyltransferase
LNFPTFLKALEARQLADLRFSEVTPALRALSSTYVERRDSALADHKALDGAGKRAAFALYYGPIHFLLIQHIVREIGATFKPGTVVDLGCGTGVGGAAVAMSATPPLRVLGVDTHPWTLDEARFTYQTLGLPFEVRRGHAAKTRFPADTSVVVAAFVVNELKGDDRDALLESIKAVVRTKPDTTGVSQAAHVLIVEPISQRISPWWNQWAEEFIRLGGRADLWKARIEPPPIVRQLAKAAGLRPDMLTARSLFV